MNKNKVPENIDEDARKNSYDINKGETNPYKYYDISRENFIPPLIYSIVLIIISPLVGVFLYEFLTKGYMPSHNTIIFAIIITLLILAVLVIIQNFKHKIWDKDEQIQSLKNILDNKDTSFRDLKGKIIESENKTVILKKQLEKCAEEKDKKIKEISNLQSERNNLITKIEHVREELQICTGIKKSYEEMVKPNIELKFFMTEERGKILGILKEDDIYNISFENKGYAPVFDIRGDIVYFPVSGNTRNFPISIAKLLPNENLAFQLGGKKDLGDCSKITLGLKYKDILGKIHSLEGEMPHI